MRDTARRASRLRLGHLMIGVVGCAVGLAEHRLDLSAHFPGLLARVLLIGNLLVAEIADGTILTGCAILAERRWRGDASYPSRAGHWLLLRTLAVHAAPLLIGLFGPMTFVIAFWIVLPINLSFAWWLWRRLPRHWATVFVVPVLSAIWTVGLPASAYAGPVLILVSFMSNALESLLIVRAIVRDRRAGAPADDLHQLGVGTTLVLDLYHVAFQVAWLF